MNTNIIAEVLVQLHKKGFIKDLINPSMQLESYFGLNPRELDNKIDHVIMKELKV